MGKLRLIARELVSVVRHIDLMGASTAGLWL